jgi:hypothetical protein
MLISSVAGTYILYDSALFMQELAVGFLLSQLTNAVQ